jgi:hypothetical protein
VLKQGMSNTNIVDRALRHDVAPRRRALSVRARALHEASYTRGRPPPQAVPLSRPPVPHDARESVPAPRTGALRAPCRPDAPPLRSGSLSATPTLVRRTTAGASRRRHHGRAVPYLSTLLSSSCCPTPRPPLHRAIHAAAAEPRLRPPPPPPVLQSLH